MDDLVHARHGEVVRVLGDEAEDDVIRGHAAHSEDVVAPVRDDGGRSGVGGGCSRTHPAFHRLRASPPSLEVVLRKLELIVVQEELKNCVFPCACQETIQTVVEVSR